MGCVRAIVGFYVVMCAFAFWVAVFTGEWTMIIPALALTAVAIYLFRSKRVAAAPVDYAPAPAKVHYAPTPAQMLAFANLTEGEFAEIAHNSARRTPRVNHIEVTGTTITLSVRSNSGLTTWEAEFDFNDHGRVTGTYWWKSENARSPIPEYFGNLVRAQIESRIGG